MLTTQILTHTFQRILFYWFT